jgi:hypothetical protein
LPELVDMTGLPWLLERGRPVDLTAPPVSKHVQVPVPHPARIALMDLAARVAVGSDSVGVTPSETPIVSTT